jgi:hypothetical protein
LNGVFAGYAACWIEHDDNIAETDDLNHFGYVADIRTRTPVVSAIMAQPTAKRSKFSSPRFDHATYGGSVSIYPLDLDGDLSVR